MNDHIKEMVDDGVVSEKEIRQTDHALSGGRICIRDPIIGRLRDMVHRRDAVIRSYEVVLSDTHGSENLIDIDKDLKKIDGNWVVRTDGGRTG